MRSDCSCDSIEGCSLLIREGVGLVAFGKHHLLIADPNLSFLTSLESSSSPESIAPHSYSHLHPFHCCQCFHFCHLVSVSYFVVLVGQLFEDSSTDSNVLQLPLLYFLYVLYAVTSLRRAPRGSWIKFHT